MCEEDEGGGLLKRCLFAVLVIGPELLSSPG